MQPDIVLITFCIHPGLCREFFWNIHYIWSLPLKICVIIGLVYWRLGVRHDL